MQKASHSQNHSPVRVSENALLLCEGDPVGLESTRRAPGGPHRPTPSPGLSPTWPARSAGDPTLRGSHTESAARGRQTHTVQLSSCGLHQFEWGFWQACFFVHLVKPPPPATPCSNLQSPLESLGCQLAPGEGVLCSLCAHPMCYHEPHPTCLLEGTHLCPCAGSRALRSASTTTSTRTDPASLLEILTRGFKSRRARGRCSGL